MNIRQIKLSLAAPYCYGKSKHWSSASFFYIHSKKIAVGDLVKFNEMQWDPDMPTTLNQDHVKHFKNRIFVCTLDLAVEHIGQQNPFALFNEIFADSQAINPLYIKHLTKEELPLEKIKHALEVSTTYYEANKKPLSKHFYQPVLVLLAGDLHFYIKVQDTIPFEGRYTCLFMDSEGVLMQETHHTIEKAISEGFEMLKKYFTANLYRCTHCNDLMLRYSSEKTIKSHCIKNGQDATLQLIDNSTFINYNQKKTYDFLRLK